MQAGKIMVTANTKGETSTMPNELKTLNKYNYKVKVKPEHFSGFTITHPKSRYLRLIFMTDIYVIITKMTKC